MEEVGLAGTMTTVIAESSRYNVRYFCCNVVEHVLAVNIKPELSGDRTSYCCIFFDAQTAARIKRIAGKSRKSSPSDLSAEQVGGGKSH